MQYIVLEKFTAGCFFLTTSPLRTNLLVIAERLLIFFYFYKKR